MASIWIWLAYVLGKLLYPIRKHDANLMTKTAAFKHLPRPNMSLEAPEYGASGSPMLPAHTCLAKDKKGGLPDLRWTAPEDTNVKEYLLVVEDPDVPLPRLVLPHGIFYRIPSSVQAATNFEIIDSHNTADHFTDAGWKYVPNLRGVPYIGAGAPYGHGVHRYFFTIVALSKALEFDESVKSITKKQVFDAIDGTVVGWGQWIGHFERPWPR